MDRGSQSRRGAAYDRITLVWWMPMSHELNPDRLTVGYSATTLQGDPQHILLKVILARRFGAAHTFVANIGVSK
jgi:hypothetical protein